MKNIILILAIMASTFSELDGSILRDTSNPPLIDKGSELTYSEFDGNFVKQYNAIQSIVDGSNVEAYDPAATYDQYSTDVYEQYCGYDSRIWKATYNGSPSSFTGQTPAEGSYWTQVSLSQLLPNIMAVADFALQTNARRGCCPQFCTAWQAITSQNLFTSPVDVVGLEAPGAGKIIIPKFIIWALEYNGVAYDYTDGLTLGYSTDMANATEYITFPNLNATTDKNMTKPSNGNIYVVNDKMQIGVNTADATVGNGTFWIKVIYQIEDAPF